MAVTITGTGVSFPSNGTIGGFYTGSTKSNLTFPVGSILMTLGFGGACSSTYLNTSGTANLLGNCFCNFGFQQPNGTATLGGTWVVRGYLFYTNAPLIQRIA